VCLPLNKIICLPEVKYDDYRSVLRFVLVDTVEYEWISDLFFGEFGKTR